MNSEVIITLSKEEHDKIAEMLEDLKDVTCAKSIKTGKFDVKFV